MSRCIFSEGKNIAFELMMQQVPRGYDKAVEAEEQNKSLRQSKKRKPTKATTLKTNRR